MQDRAVDDGPDVDTGNLALAFVNTLRLEDGWYVDEVASPAELLAWMRRARLLPDDAHRAVATSPPDARILLDETRRLREVLLDAVSAFARGAPFPSTLLLELNRSLRRRRTSFQAVDGPEGIHIAEVREPAPVGGLLAPVAEAAVALLGEADPRRVRQCRAEDCSLWFLDGSKNGSRKWCSMARCGNRAKVAAHYRRSRR